MSNEKNNPDQILDDAIAEIRAETMDQTAVDQAAARVWAKVAQAAAGAPAEARRAGEPLRTCDDFRALIPALLAGKLPDAQAWLLEDHVHGCPQCRQALASARSGKVVELTSPPQRKPLAPQWKWAIAAALTVGVGIGAWQMRDSILPAPSGPRGVVASVNGLLYSVSDTGSTPIMAGAALGEREYIRTARGGHAMVRLTDGSLVEMRERSELSLSRKFSGTTIRLERGSVIVQAAKQRRGRLYVATNDCLVSVKGTIFAVDHGTKGSRVAVIQGEVRVDEASQTRMLHPGDQVSTDSAMAAVSIKDDISWSQNLNQYLALLGEFSAMQKQLEQIPGPGLRYSSRLLDLAPDGTVLYVAIPNIGGMLGDAQRIFQERLDQSTVLRDWWNSNGNSQDLQKAIDTVRGFSDYLGNEVVVTVSSDASGQYRAPLVMAEVAKPGFREFLTQQIAQFSGQANRPQLTVVDNPSSLPAAGGQGHDALVLLTGDVVAMSPDPANLRAVAALVAQPGSGTFAQTAFYQQIAADYRAGAGWLIAANMEQIVKSSVSQGERHHPEMQARQNEKAIFGQLGVFDVQSLTVERKEVGGKTENRAVLTFSQPRRGMASWLASPAPMGALDFISPEASVATAFVVKQPRAALEELFSAIQTVDPNFANGQAQFESQAGISLLNDLAGPLGGEVAFAIDGPLLPSPGWKFAIEVYDPVRLEHTIESLAAKAAAQSQGPKWSVNQVQSGGRTYYALESPQSPFAIHYTFVDGYLAAAANQALLMQALSQRAAGYSLPRSAGFKSLLSPDGYSNFSAVLYQNLKPVLGPVAAQLRALGTLNPETQKSIDQLSANATPTLVYAYGQPDRIEVASSGSFFGFNLDTLMGAGSPFQIPGLLGRAARAHPNQ
ncbi:MAG TPA: FecR domain-containing protein [Bryobacteraceae bacterium]|nr:FecR domain-containing protein [Bryobacteraceae bacterium]